MSDFKERAIISYVTLTISIPALAHWMERNGADHSGNPAWALVSGARSIIFSSFAVLIGAALLIACLHLLCDQLTKPENSEKTYSPIKQSSESIAARRAEEARWIAELEAQRRIQATRQEEVRRERERIAEEHERAKLEIERVKTKERLTRSFSAAVEAALEEF